MRPIYLLVGVPGVGKSTVAAQLKDKFDLVANDEHIGKDYVGAILKASGSPGKPILAEAPFSISNVLDPLRAKGRHVHTVFIIEPERVLSDRYFHRDKKPIPIGHITRQKTYMQRALDSKSFQGTSAQVLDHLRKTK